MSTHRPSSNKKSKPPAKDTRSRRKASRKRKDKYDHNFLALMEKCPDAETLNAQVITPFVQALVAVCNARGYVFNIYGDHCNIAVTPENHAEPLYHLINTYMDEAGLE